MTSVAAEYEPPTEDEVYDHIANIPSKYLPCAAAKHNWEMKKWVAYTAGGRITKDPNKAATFDITEACMTDRAGQCGCGLQRDYPARFNRRAGALEPTGEYVYSNRNPLLVSPRGISFTGISKRTVAPGVIKMRKILKPRIQLAPTGSTRRALKKVAG